MKLHEAVGHIYTLEELSCAEQSVLIALVFRAGLSGSCWPSLSRIALDARVGTSSVSRALKSLTEKGLIGNESGSGRKSSMYHMWYSLSYHSGNTTAHHDNTTAHSGGTTAHSGNTDFLDSSSESCLTTVGTQPYHSGNTTAHSGVQTEKENNCSTKEVVDNIQSISREEIRVPLHQATPLDVWVSEAFTEFGYSLPIPVAANIAAKTLSAMSRDFAEEYITERLCELTGQSQSKVVKYVLQDGPTWLQRRLNPPPAREAKGRKRDKERIVDEGVRTYQPPVPDDFWANQTSNQGE